MTTTSEVGEPCELVARIVDVMAPLNELEDCELVWRADVIVLVPLLLALAVPGNDETLRNLVDEETTTITSVSVEP
jgi:hypothetical protein